MASDSDEISERLIEDLRPKLRRLIVVNQVLDQLNFIEPDQKERIRQREATDGNIAAAEVLITAVVKKPHEPGWFQAFVDALEHSGCGYAADIMQDKTPKPEVEAENDYFVKLIQLMSPSLLDMKTEDVCFHCVSRELLTVADGEAVSAFALFGLSLRSLATRWRTTSLHLRFAQVRLSSVCRAFPPDRRHQNEPGAHERSQRTPEKNREGSSRVVF